MDTNVVLFNLFEFPSYLKYCISQIKYHSPNTKVHLISDKNIQSADGVEVYHVNQFATTVILSNSNIRYFQDNQVKEHRELFFSSALRFLYIEELVRNLNLVNVFTFDNDVLIYNNLEDIACSIPEDRGFAITQALDDELICGMTYFRSPDDLVEIAGDFMHMFDYTESELVKILGSNIKGKQPNEMCLLNLISNKRNINKYIFPSIPESAMSNQLFDPISYGQYLSGRSGVGDDSFVDENHYIGDLIKQKKLTCHFNRESKTPYVQNKYGEFALNNLHVHGKNLKDFISY